MRAPLCVLVGCLACSNQAVVPADGGAGDVVVHDSATASDAPTDVALPSEAGGDAGIPAGWLYTQGGGIYVSNGTSGTRWMGRGVNVDDLYFCGYNNSLWMSGGDATLSTMFTHLLSDWKPTFVRISLGMNSFPTVSSWTSGNAAAYKTPMTSVINALASSVYVLVTLRSDVSMPMWNNNDATGVPTTNTDAVYRALVDTFASSKSVLFGLSNEPGGSSLSNATIVSAMTHAVAIIRAEEDKLGVPHHIVSVQGNGWTSDISFWASSPIAADNVVYEVHGYPPPTTSYTYGSIPVIIGEYGNLPDAAAFYADVETKQIPNLAWDFESYSDCSPDLLTVNQSASNLVPTSWGTTVRSYLLAH
jgi:hypothetical protein